MLLVLLTNAFCSRLFIIITIDVCVCVNVVWVCAHCEPLFVNSAYRTLLHCTINGREEDKDKIIEKAIWQTAYKMKAMELPNRKCHQPSADRTVCPNIHRNEHIKFRRNQSYINLNTYLLHRLTSVDSACIDGWRIAVSLSFFFITEPNYCIIYSY